METEAVYLKEIGRLIERAIRSALQAQGALDRIGRADSEAAQALRLALDGLEDARGAL